MSDTAHSEERAENRASTTCSIRVSREIKQLAADFLTTGFFDCEPNLTEQEEIEMRELIRRLNFK